MSAEGQTPAVAYVDWLLGQMTAASRMAMVIDTRRPLPGSIASGASGAFDAAGGMPGAESVLNRLKVLSGLSPVRYSRSMEGRFEKKAPTFTWLVQTAFLDDAQGSTCRIQLKIQMPPRTGGTGR